MSSNGNGVAVENFLNIFNLSKVDSDVAQMVYNKYWSKMYALLNELMEKRKKIVDNDMQGKRLRNAAVTENKASTLFAQLRQYKRQLSPNSVVFNGADFYMESAMECDPSSARTLRPKLPSRTSVRLKMMEKGLESPCKSARTVRIVECKNSSRVVEQLASNKMQSFRTPIPVKSPFGQHQDVHLKLKDCETPHKRNVQGPVDIVKTPIKMNQILENTFKTPTKDSPVPSQRKKRIHESVKTPTRRNPLLEDTFRTPVKEGVLSKNTSRVYAKMVVNKGNVKRSEIIRNLEAKVEMVSKNKEENVRNKAERAKRDREERELRVKRNNRIKEEQLALKRELVLKKEMELEQFRKQQIDGLTPKSPSYRMMTRHLAKMKVIASQKLPDSLLSKGNPDTEMKSPVRKVSKFVYGGSNDSIEAIPRKKPKINNGKTSKALEASIEIVEPTQIMPSDDYIELKEISARKDVANTEKCEEFVGESSCHISHNVYEGNDHTRSIKRTFTVDNNPDDMMHNNNTESENIADNCEGDSNLIESFCDGNPRTSLVKWKESAPWQRFFNVTSPPLPEHNYDINDLTSGDETDDEDNPRKKVPEWAQMENVLLQMEIQSKMVVADDILGPICLPDLAEVFGRKKARYAARNSSAVWYSPLNEPRPGFKKSFAVPGRGA